MSTLLRRAYNYIHQKILAGELTPGSVISEARIADELGISRTPVGEAIRQLASQGLVHQVPRFGTIVRLLDRQDLIEMYELREALETFSVAQAAHKMSSAQLAKLAESCEAMRAVHEQHRKRRLQVLDGDALATFLAHDLAFHMLIIQAAGNRRIIKIVEDTRTVSRIFHTQRVEHNLQIVDEAYRYHRRILKALKEKSPDAARDAMAEHIRRSKEYSLRQYDERPAEAGSASSAKLNIPVDLA